MGGRIALGVVVLVAVGTAAADAIPPYLAGAKCGDKHASLALEGSGSVELDGLATDEVRIRDGRMVIRPRIESEVREATVIVHPDEGSRMKYGVIIGTRGDDRLKGGRPADILIASRGDDVLTGKGNGDLMCGGRGRDEATDHTIADITRSAKHDSPVG